MKIIDVEQGTLEWQAERRCRVMGTDLCSVMGSSLERIQLIAEKIAEEGTEQSKVFRATVEMERGTAEEIFAIRSFEKKTKRKVDRVGICVSDEFNWLGFSPDGLIKDKNGKYTENIEVKSPDSKTAVFYQLTNLVGVQELGLGTWSKATKEKPSEFKPSAKAPFLGVPADYKWQVVASFLVNEAQKKCNFLVYDARFIDDEAKMYVIEVQREHPLMQEAIKQAREALIAFREEWLRYKQVILVSNF